MLCIRTRWIRSGATATGNHVKVTCTCAHAPQMDRSAEEKDCLWDQMLSVTGSIAASKLIVVGGHMNGHVRVPA